MALMAALGMLLAHKPQPVQARSSFLNVFVASYPAAVSSKLNSCQLLSHGGLAGAQQLRERLRRAWSQLPGDRTAGLRPGWLVEPGGDQHRHLAGRRVRSSHGRRHGDAPHTRADGAFPDGPIQAHRLERPGHALRRRHLRCLFDPAALQQPVGADWCSNPKVAAHRKWLPRA